MFARDYEDVMQKLLERYCGPNTTLEFTNDMGVWCKDCGTTPPKPLAPIHLMNSEDGLWRLCLLEVTPEESVHERIKALSIRWALQSTTTNLADRLDSDKKKLVYLFLKEFAGTDPDLNDELVADNWIFGELRKYGLFKE